MRDRQRAATEEWSPTSVLVSLILAASTSLVLSVANAPTWGWMGFGVVVYFVVLRAERS